MKRTPRLFEIADPFYAALETMSREMNVDRDTLVNQALFGLARANGFLAPTVVAFDAVPEDVDAATPPAPRRSAPISIPAPSAPVASSESGATSIGSLPSAPTRISSSMPDDEGDESVPAHGGVDVDAPTSDGLSRDDADEANEQGSDPSVTGKSGGHEDALGEDDLDSTRSDQHQREDDDESADADHLAMAGHKHHDPPTQTEPVKVTAAPATTTAPPESLAKTGTVPIDRTVVVRPTAGLRVFIQATEGPELEVLPGRFVIGRGDNCNLIIDSLRVSREHASVHVVGTEVVVEDLGSSNGTWFNGEKITRRQVVNGDEIVLGNERVVFRFDTSL